MGNRFDEIYEKMRKSLLEITMHFFTRCNTSTRNTCPCRKKTYDAFNAKGTKFETEKPTFIMTSRLFYSLTKPYAPPNVTINTQSKKRKTKYTYWNCHSKKQKMPTHSLRKLHSSFTHQFQQRLKRNPSCSLSHARKAIEIKTITYRVIQNLIPPHSIQSTLSRTNVHHAKQKRISTTR